MRVEFAKQLIQLAITQPNLLFLTGDLGYKALEGVQTAMGNRFINMGVAEQNMISVAAGLAHQGFIPITYSIAPFAMLRPYEQIRNDVCLHNLPVKIVGNGGGYGYGIMGATHHVPEDIAVMRILPNMKVYVPLTTEDVGQSLQAMMADAAPNYLRLNLEAKLPHTIEPFTQWRKIKTGNKAVVIVTGTVAGNLFQFANEGFFDDLEIWYLGILPTTTLPNELISSIKQKQKVLVMEECSNQCGINELMAKLILQQNISGINYHTLATHGYPSGRYGSQQWHQQENNLQGDGLKKQILSLLNE
jgi:transketolase